MATGTGYPTIKTGGERTAISGTVAADSGASQWQRIANIGEQLSKTATNIGEKEAYAQYVSAVADHEVEGRNFERAARDKHAFDPKGYEATMQGFIAGKLGEMPPQLVPHMKQFYSRQMDSGHSAVMGERRQRDIGLQTNAIIANTTQLSERVIDHGNAGTLDTPDGKKAQQDFVSGVQSGVAAERYSQEQADLTIQQTVEKAQQAAASRKAVDVYRDKGYESAVVYLQKTIRDNTALKMGATDKKKLYEVALKNLNAAQLEDRRNSGQITNDVERSEQLALDGNPPPPAKMAELEVRVGAIKDPVTTKRMSDAKEVIDFVTTARQMTVPQVESKLATEIAAKVAAGDTEGAKRIRDSGEKLLKTMKSNLKDNPLNWAQKTGEVPVTPIDFNNEATMGPAMQSRISAAEEFAKKHGIAPTYLLPGEQTQLQAALARGGTSAIKVAEMIASPNGFGTRAPQVMGEIAKDAPVLAHVGQMVTTNPRFAADAAETIAVQQDPESAKRLPRNLNKPDKEIRTNQDAAASETIGPAFVLNPNAGLTIKGAADAAFIARARRNSSLDPTLLDSTSKKEYTRALQESAGATYDRDGTQRGGIVKYGGSGIWPFNTPAKQVLIPMTVKANRFGDVLGAITDTDLAAHPNPPVRAGGQPYTAEAIKKATPVATPDGYRFAAGDPGSSDPQWIQGRNGAPFVLNWGLIEPTLRKRMPDAF